MKSSNFHHFVALIRSLFLRHNNDKYPIGSSGRSKTTCFKAPSRTGKIVLFR
jgi:hypothetical protein